MTDREPETFAETTIYREARSMPRPYDPEAVKLEVSKLADATLAQLGGRAPASTPGEDKCLHVARIGETLAGYGPKERRSIPRRSLPFRELAEVVRVDLELAQREIEHPWHSLADGEVREVTRLDEAGRPFVSFHSRTEGPRFWMDQFAEPTIRVVSRGTNGIATERHPLPPGYTPDRSTLPEARRYVRLVLERAHADTLAQRRKAGLPPPSVVEMQSWPLK